MTDIDVTRGRHNVADPLREFADAISKHAGYGVTMPNPLSVHSGAPVGPTSETEDLYALADQIDTEHERLEQGNVKLRELVETMRVGMREMLGIMGRSSYTWGYCRYYGECLDAAEGIMRELGIEVSE